MVENIIMLRYETPIYADGRQPDGQVDIRPDAGITVTMLLNNEGCGNSGHCFQPIRRFLTFFLNNCQSMSILLVFFYKYNKMGCSSSQHVETVEKVYSLL